MPVVSPLLRIRCPYCREKFHPGDCAIISSINVDPNTNTPKVLRRAPRPGTLDYARARAWIDELIGPEYVTEMARRECPHCQKLLFEGIETCDNLNIAIVGDTSSGKTHYIAVLIDQLKRGFLIQDNSGFVRLMHLNEYTSNTYRDRYYRPIIQNRTTVKGTEPGRYDAAGRPVKTEPLVYQLHMQDHTGSVSNTINLLLYDISGEDIADDTKLVQFGEHILRADGIIYLADPLSMAHLYQRLPVHLQPPQMTGRTAEEVLSTMMFRLEQYNRVRSGQNISIPTAIVVPKADLLQYVIGSNERANFRFMHKTHYDGKVHLEELWYIDQEVRSILQRYGEFSLLQMSQRFDQVGFFAVSATGNAPDSNNKYAFIQPHRCLDPFIWILWKLAFLQGVR